MILMLNDNGGTDSGADGAAKVSKPPQPRSLWGGWIWRNDHTGNLGSSEIIQKPWRQRRRY